MCLIVCFVKKSLDPVLFDLSVDSIVLIFSEDLAHTLMNRPPDEGRLMAACVFLSDYGKDM